MFIHILIYSEHPCLQLPALPATAFFLNLFFLDSFPLLQHFCHSFSASFLILPYYDSLFKTGHRFLPGALMTSFPVTLPFDKFLALSSVQHCQLLP